MHPNSECNLWTGAGFPQQPSQLEFLCAPLWTGAGFPQQPSQLEFLCALMRHSCKCATARGLPVVVARVWSCWVSSVGRDFLRETMWGNASCLDWRVYGRVLVRVAYLLVRVCEPTCVLLFLSDQGLTGVGLYSVAFCCPYRCGLARSSHWAGHWQLQSRCGSFGRCSIGTDSR